MIRSTRPPSRAPLSLVALAVVTALAIGCSDEPAPRATEPVTPELAPVAAYSLLTAEPSTAPGVYFLAPLSDETAGTGPVDASLLEHVTFQVCERTASGGCGAILATMTAGGTSGAAPAPGKGKGGGDDAKGIHLSDEGTYQGVWSVKGVAAGTAVRIRVLVGGTDLGHADGLVVANMKDAKSIQAQGFAPIQAQRSLPIQVRIEEGAVWVVGPEGGSFSALDGAGSFDVPAGALSAPVGLTVHPAADPLPEPTLVPGTAFDVGPSGVSFGAPIGVVLRYGDARSQPDTVPTGRLRLHRVEDEDGPAQWVQDFPSTPDEEAAAVTGQLDRTGTIAVLRRRAPARVEVTPEGPTLTAFEETATLTAVAYAAGGWAITDADFEWTLASTEDGEVLGPPLRDGPNGETATVEALANGTAAVHVSTEGVAGAGSVTVRQVAADIDLTLGAAELDAFDATTTVDALVRDANGHPIEDEALFALVWSSGDAGIATLAGTGPRSALATATGNGEVTLTASDASAASGTAELTVQQVPFGIALVSGDGQVANAGAILPQPFVAEVQDANGHPIADVAVEWSVLSGGGTLSASTGATDAAGRTEGTLTLGQTVEPNEAQVFVVDVPDATAVFAAMPIAAAVPTSGGTVSVLGGAVTLDIPAGALSSTQPISVRPVDPDELGLDPGDVLPGTLYDFGPDGLVFDATDDVIEPAEVTEDQLPSELQAGDADPPDGEDPDAAEEAEYLDDEIDEPVEEIPTETLELEVPVQLTLKYTELPEGLDPSDEDALVIAKWDPETEEWIEQDGSQFDPLTKTVSAPVKTFSLYGVRPRVRPLVIRGPATGPLWTWATFRANAPVTWKAYRKNQWGGKLALNRTRQVLGIAPYGPGPWIVQATAKTCGWTHVSRKTWIDYALLKRLVLQGRITQPWSYVRDANGKVVRRVVRGRLQVVIDRPARKWTCTAVTARHTYRALSPLPHSVVLKPGGSRSLPSLGSKALLYVRVFESRGRLMPWARVVFQASVSGVLQAANVKDAYGWDRWLIRASGYGSTQLKAVAYGGKQSNVMTVSIDLVPANISVTPSTVTLSEPGASASLSASVRNQYGFPVQDPLMWTSSSPAVSVDGNGRVTGIAAGQAVVTAMTSNGLTASATVTVESPPPPPTPPTPVWNVSGPGATTAEVQPDGSGFTATATYSLSGSAVFSTQTWQFSSAASSTGTVTLPWRYNGFHAYFQVRAFLTAFVRRPDGSETTYPIFSYGPVNCCSSPSNGFDYNGTVNLPVQAGDTYGLRFGGMNFDGDSRLIGTVRVTLAPEN